ncbi:cytochrome P450 [Nonomuraea sp. NPDC049400]|uniref:cytochrome P450 n=1 Tax=Nonomuraea sp. NPDC049400 TaxID=3364352 RepID=UPI003796344A
MSNTYYRDEPVTPFLDRAPAFPFDPAPSLTALRAEQPIARLAAPEGAPGVWIITGYDLVRQILADPRFSSRHETHYHPLPPAPVGALTDEEPGGVAAFLLGAGLDTTANMLALGTFALLRDPAQLAALRGDPDLAVGAVEELLRYLSVAATGMRGVLEDVELGGRQLKAGDTVIIAINAANRDPARFSDPDVLDLRRSAAGHLAFGHGVHQCLGQQLARIEMRVAFPALLHRFPTLRLAVPAEELSLRTDPSQVYGVHSLPVTWDRG